MRCAVTQFQQRIGARIRAPHRTCVCGFMRTQALIARLELSSRSRSVRSDGSGFVPLHAEKHRTDHPPNWRITASRFVGVA